MNSAFPPPAKRARGLYKCHSVALLLVASGSWGAALASSQELDKELKAAQQAIERPSRLPAASFSGGRGRAEAALRLPS